MAPNAAGTTVARVGPATGNQTSAAFNAPASSIILACVVVDTSGTTNTTVTMSNSGTALTWVSIARQGSNEVGARPGTVAAFYAVVAAARTGITITASSSITGRNVSVKPYVITGVDLADVLGAVLEGSAAVGNNILTTTALSTESDDSLVFVVANESEVGPGNPTCASTTIDAYSSAGNHSGLSGYRSVPTAGTSVQFVVDAAGTSTAVSWNWVAFEIRGQLASIVASGIPSAETFGSGTITTGPVSVTSTGIATTELFGDGRISITVSSLGIPTAELVSSAGVIDIPGFISSLGIPSAEAFGTSFVQLKNITPLGIPTAEAFGSGSVLAGAVSLTTTGIASVEAFGVGQINYTIYGIGIPTAQAFGTGTMVAGPISITSSGIPSEESFGVHRVVVTIDTATRGLSARLRVTPIYELLVMARIPQKSGTPTFLLVDPIEWSTLNWSSALSKPQSLTANCQIASITEPVRQQLRNPDRLPTELWLQRNGKTVFAGPLLGGMEQEDEISLEAGGLLTYLQGMFVLSDLRYTAMDQFLITTALINQWQVTDYGHFGIDTTGVVPCGKVRDAAYDRNEIHKLDIRIDELGKRADGFDYEVDPSTRALKLWYPGKGVDRSTGEDAVVFDGRSIDGRGGMFSLAPGDLASVAFGSATPAGAEKSIWSEMTNNDLLVKYGRMAIAGSWADVPDQATLDDQVSGLLDARDQPLRVPGKQVRVTPDTDLDTYDVGDLISYELSGLLGISGAYRIRSRAVAVSETGEEDVTLEFV